MKKIYQHWVILAVAIIVMIYSTVYFFYIRNYFPDHPVSSVCTPITFKSYLTERVHRNHT